MQQLDSPPPQFTFPELLMNPHHSHHHHHPAAEQQELHHYSPLCSELSSNTSTPFVSAPSSPTSSFRASYSSTPSSPSRAHFILNLSQPQPLSASTPYPSSGSSVGHTLHPQISPQTELRHGSSTAYQTQHRRTSPSSDQTTDQSSFHGRSFGADNLSGSHWRHRFLQAEQDHNPCTDHKPLQSIYHDTRTVSTGALESRQTEHQRRFCLPDQAHMYEGGPDQPVCDTRHSHLTSLQAHHAGSRSWWTQRESPQADHPHGFSVSQKALQAEHIWNFHGPHASDPEGKNLPATQSHVIQDSHSTVSDSIRHTAFKRPQAEDNDAEYCRKGFYSSAVPFSWEEKPGTPKARSVTSEVSNGESDSPSTCLSGSSDFEFCAQFPELEETPRSPTPISPTFHSFRSEYVLGSPATPAQTDMEDELWTGYYGQTIRPLRLPPRLDSPVLPMKRSTTYESNDPKVGYGSVASLSAPQSPRSPGRFDIRGVLCGMSSPHADAVFDPFLAAMEKSTVKKGYDVVDAEMGKSAKKNESRLYGHEHHRRTRSLSPLRVFHWDEQSARSNSSSNGSSTDEVKNKHPIQREINARHSAEMPKRSKRWSLRGLLHRKSVSGADSTRPSYGSASFRSSGQESCSSPGVISINMEDNAEINAEIRGSNWAINSNPSKQSSMPSTPSSILSPSSSINSSRGKANPPKLSKGAYAHHYGMQRAQAEELRKRTPLPYKQGLLGCLGLSSKGYRVMTTLSKPLQSVS